MFRVLALLTQWGQCLKSERQFGKMKEGDNCIKILPINEFLLCIGFTAVHIPNFCADTLPGLQYGDPEVDKRNRFEYLDQAKRPDETNATGDKPSIFHQHQPGPRRQLQDVLESSGCKTDHPTLKILMTLADCATSDQSCPPQNCLWPFFNAATLCDMTQKYLRLAI